MMLRKIRILLIYSIVFLLCFVFMFFDIKKEVLVLLKKRREEMQLSMTVETTKKNLIDMMRNKQPFLFQADTTLLDTANVLAYLGHFFVLQAIQINKMQMLKVKTINGVSMLPVKVSAISQFSSFIKLITALFNGPWPLMINDFSFQRDKNGAVAAEMQLFVFGVRATKSQRSGA